MRFLVPMGMCLSDCVDVLSVEVLTFARMKRGTEP